MREGLPEFGAIQLRTARVVRIPCDFNRISVARCLASCARRVLPFRFRRQPPPGPLAVRPSFLPGHVHHRVVVALREIGGPKSLRSNEDQLLGRLGLGSTRKSPVGTDGDLSLPHPEPSADGHPMTGLLVGIAGRASILAILVVRGASHLEVSWRDPHIALPVPRIHSHLTWARAPDLGDRLTARLALPGATIQNKR